MGIAIDAALYDATGRHSSTTRWEPLPLPVHKGLAEVVHPQAGRTRSLARVGVAQPAGVEDTTPSASPAARRLARRRTVEAYAEAQAGVLTRTQLYANGTTRGEVRNNVRAARWQVLGWHCVVLHTGPLTDASRLWAAVLEAGPRAQLDGGSALVAAGLERYDLAQVRVSVPRGARIRHRGTSIDIRQTRRWDPDDVAPGSSPPRTRTPVAAVRAALWARTDREATLVLSLVVSQGLATTAELAVELMRIRRDRRRVHVGSVLLDLAGGAGSLGEIDVLRGCRERGLPEPEQQVLRRTPSGTYFLDFRWRRWGVVLEVDGVQHTWVENVVADAVRQNEVVLENDLVLRLPLLGLRLAPDVFFDQLRQALRRRGWRSGDVLAS